MEYGHSSAPKKWTDTSSSIAPALLGASAGIFLGDLMHRGARRPVASALFCLGAAALAPSISGLVKDKMSGPKTRKGSQRTLSNIRDGAAIPEDQVYGEEIGI